MYNLYEYARTRLFVTQFQRDKFLDMLVKRMLKSVARSTGARIHTNKWLRLFDHLFVSATPGCENILEEVKTALLPYAITHKQSCLRITFMMDMIKDARGSSNTRYAYKPVFNRYENEFSEQGQLTWMHEVATKQGYSKQECGHWEITSRRINLRGNNEREEFIQAVCTDCGAALLQSGTRIQARNGEYILAAFAVEVRSYGDHSYINDRRAPGIRFNVQRQIYHDDNWSPYANLIDGYHTSRNKGFKLIESPWFKANRRAFGCELEVQVRSGDANAAAGRVHEALNPSGNVGEYCYFERDGSIGTGFELITQPAGLDVHREKFALFLKDTNMKRGMRSHEGGACGFHVHVGREFVTQSQIYRIQSFLNDVRNEALIRSIARRYDSGYCKYKHSMAKFTPHNKNTGDRYESLNVTNEKTIEFRIFRGSLRYESIMTALEFVNAVLTFCTPGETSILDFNSIGFKRWLMRPENKHDTKFLRSYLSLDATGDNELQAA